MKWTERYNCYNAQLPGGLGLGANWSSERDKPGYKASAFGNRVGLYPTLEEAQNAAIEYARKTLTEALAALARK